MPHSGQYDEYLSKSSGRDADPMGLKTSIQINPIKEEGDLDGKHLRLYWARTISCVLSPIFVSGYYAAIWARWLNSYDDHGTVAQGPAHARWVYYIWFVTSALGIGLSKYGLAGIEAAMLMDKKWAPSNAMQLMRHCDKVSSSLLTRIR